MSVPPEIERIAIGLTLSHTHSCWRGYRIEPVEYIVRSEAKSSAAGFQPLRSHICRYAGLVPNAVMRSRATICQSESAPVSGASLTTISQPLASADSCQFHIIQPVEVWKNSLSSGV